MRVNLKTLGHSWIFKLRDMKSREPHFAMGTENLLQVLPFARAEEDLCKESNSKNLSDSPHPNQASAKHQNAWRPAPMNLPFKQESVCYTFKPKMGSSAGSRQLVTSKSASTSLSKGVPMWSVILTVGLQLVGWFLERSKVSEEHKKAFFEFVKRAGSDLSSVKLMQYADKQIKWFDENPEWKESL